VFLLADASTAGQVVKVEDLDTAWPLPPEWPDSPAATVGQTVPDDAQEVPLGAVECLILDWLLVISAVARVAMPGLSGEVAIRVGIRKTTRGATGLRVVNLTVVGLAEGTAIVVWLIGIVAIT